MDRIVWHRVWYDMLVKIQFRQVQDFRSGRKHWKLPKKRNAFVCGGRVSAFGLVKDGF